MKYKKKPVIIDAIKYDGSKHSYSLIGKMGDIKRYQHPSQGDEFQIITLEGEHTCSVGDYVIKGIKGEFYPCKPDVFEMTYEKVDEI